MIERYCRYADPKAGGQAVLLALKRGENTNRTVNAEKLESTKTGGSNAWKQRLLSHEVLNKPMAEKLLFFNAM